MWVPTEYEIAPLMVAGQPYTGVAVRYGCAWLGVVMTDTAAASEYIHLPVGDAAVPRPAPPRLARADSAAAAPRCRRVLMASAWSQAAALSRLQHNHVLQHALHVEPRLQALLDQALQPPESGYRHEQIYATLRAASRYLVGPRAENPQLRAPLSGEALLLALADMLPPDDWDSATSTDARRPE